MISVPLDRGQGSRGSDLRANLVAAIVTGCALAALTACGPQSADSDAAQRATETGAASLYQDRKDHIDLRRYQWQLEQNRTLAAEPSLFQDRRDHAALRRFQRDQDRSVVDKANP